MKYIPTELELLHAWFTPVWKDWAFILILDKEDLDSDDCIIWKPNEWFKMTMETVAWKSMRKIYPKSFTKLKESIELFSN